MIRRHLAPLAVLLLVTGCSADSGGAAATSTSGPTSPSASASVSETASAPTGAYFLDLRTGEQTPLATTSGEKGAYGAAFDDGHYYAVSPDGSRVYWEDACCYTTDVAATASIDGSSGRRMDPEGAVNFYAGVWSPDSSSMVYQRSGADFDVLFGDLFVEDVDSGRATRIARLSSDVPGDWYVAPIFSADGRSVVYEYPRTRSGTQWDIWSVPVTGGEPRLLVRNATNPASFGGRFDVFTRPMGDNLGARLVIMSKDGVRTSASAVSEIHFPRVSPDGSKVAYEDTGSIYVVDVATGKSDEVAYGRMAAWVDDDTLLVAPE